jgi:hypothetical protein
MDPLLHLFFQQQRRPFSDSPALARRREALGEHDRERRSARAHRRRERVRRAVALVTAPRSWRFSTAPLPGENRRTVSYTKRAATGRAK